MSTSPLRPSTAAKRLQAFLGMLLRCKANTVSRQLSGSSPELCSASVAVLEASSPEERVAAIHKAQKAGVPFCELEQLMDWADAQGANDGEASIGHDATSRCNGQATRV